MLTATIQDEMRPKFIITDGCGMRQPMGTIEQVDETLTEFASLGSGMWHVYADFGGRWVQIR